MSEKNDFIQLPPIKKDTPSEVVSMIWQYLKLPEESRKRVTADLIDVDENCEKEDFQIPDLYDIVPKEEIAEFEETMRKIIAGIISQASSVATWVYVQKYVKHKTLDEMLQEWKRKIGIWGYMMIIKIVTISLMAVFYICYFAKLISQKKQGIKTDQLGKGKEGFVKFIEVALKIITYLLPVIQIISIVFYSGTAHIVLQFTGVVITMFGVLAFIVSVTQMKENWRAGVQKEEKTSLVTTGIYSISRNPAFLGFDLMYIGILFSFFNWFLCFATGFAVVFFHLQIVNVEEDFLIKAFGNEYLQYKSKVCRYLGRKR